MAGLSCCQWESPAQPGAEVTCIERVTSPGGVDRREYTFGLHYQPVGQAAALRAEFDHRFTAVESLPVRRDSRGIG